MKPWATVKYLLRGLRGLQHYMATQGFRYGRLHRSKPAGYKDVGLLTQDNTNLNRLANRNLEQILCHHRRALRSEHNLLHQPHRWPIRHCHMGLGPRLPDLPLHCRFTGRNMRRLSHRGRSILLECYALHEEIRTYRIVDNGLVDIGGKLDGHDQYQFRRSAIDLVRHYTVEG